MKIRNRIRGSSCLIACILALGAFAGSRTASAAQLLRGAVVWEYDDSSIAVQYQGQNKFYTPSEFCGGGGGGGPLPPPYPGCPNTAPEPQLTRDPYLHSVTIPLSRQAGGTLHALDLSQFHRVKKLQVRVLRGAVQIHAADYTQQFTNNPTSLPELVKYRLCEGQGTTVALEATGLRRLELRMEGYHVNDATVELNVQYERARCGGCNSYGCWVDGGGCNSYGCYIPSGGCNSYGCYVPGGGCNSYGCWMPGGSCNSYGCQKPASSDAGSAPTRPACE